MTSSNNNNNSQLMDPKLALPPEMFSQLLSFLNPTEICTTSETCKSWREAINSNPVLHQEIDLSRLDWFAQTDYFLQTFQRLSALALNRPFKITLNLSSFYRDWIKWIESRSSAPFQRLDELLSSVQTSSEQLQEVSILIVPRLGARDSLPFLLPLVYQLFEYPEMRRISIEAPSLIDLKAGSSNSKSFFMKSEPDGLEEDPSGLPLYLKRVKEFVGSSFVQFDKYGDPLVSDASGIWEELLGSEDTLQKLSLCSDTFIQSARGLWDFGWSCPNLEELNLQIYDEVEEEDHEKLEIKEGLDKAVELKKLSLTMESQQIDWKNVPDRVGNHLEDLEISMQSQRSEGDLVSSGALRSMITNSRSTLKNLNLKGVGWETNQEQVFSWSTSFPSLEKLSLVDVHPTLLNYFSKLDSLRLHHLELGCTHHRQSQALNQEMFQCLFELLKLYESELAHLSFFLVYDSNSIKFAPKGLYKFKFAKLSSVYIDDGSSSLMLWFLTLCDNEQLRAKISENDGSRYKAF